jgi:hypothetical protein
MDCRCSLSGGATGKKKKKEQKPTEIRIEVRSQPQGKQFKRP